MARWVKAASGQVIRQYEQSLVPGILQGVTLGDLWVDTNSTPELKICTSISPITWVSVGGGGGQTAPSDAQYVVLAANGTLTNESVLGVGSSKLTLSGATLDIDQTQLSIASTQITGTKTSSYISDFNTVVGAAAPVQSVNGLTGTVSLTSTNISEGSNLYFTDERVDDRVAVLIQNGTGITWSYNDGSNTLTPTISITQYTDELAQDAIGSILTDTNTIDLTYEDGSNLITVDLKCLILPIVTKTSNYTLTITDYCVLGDATGGNITLTLPSASTTGMVKHIKKINSSILNTVTINTTGGATIDGSASVTLSAQYTSIMVISDGTNWFTSSII